MSAWFTSPGEGDAAQRVAVSHIRRCAAGRLTSPSIAKVRAKTRATFPSRIGSGMPWARLRMAPAV
jgi:hypothetical protein